MIGAQRYCDSLDYCHMFVDLRRNTISGAFGWADGTPFGPGFYSAWALGKPDNVGGSEDCVELNRDGLWNDISCHAQRFWMCEKSAIVEQSTTSTTTDTTTAPTTTESTVAPVATVSTASSTTTTTATSLDCEDGWSLYQQSCYRIGGPFGFFSMDPGSADCESRGALPVSIKDAGENAFVSELQSHFIATSGSCSVVDRCQLYIGLRRSSGMPFAWLDGTSFEYSNWAPTEPNNATGSEHCVEMRSHNGLWYDVPCHFVRIWMCEKSASTMQSPTPTTTGPAATTEASTTTTTTTTSPTFACQDLWGWHLYQKSCYKLHERVTSFDAGLAQCQGQGAVPVTIVAAGENAFINQLHMSTRHTFVCERGDGACQVMFLGLRRNSAGSFGWYDGTPFGTGSYVNWALGEHKSAGSEPCTGTNGCNNCVEMNLDGTWNNIQCDFNDVVFGHDWHSIMCEKPAHTSWIPGQSE